MKKSLLKKITALGLVTSMVIASAMTTTAATTEWEEVFNFDFSNSTGLIGATVAGWSADDKATITAADITSVADGVFTAGTQALIADETIDASLGLKMSCKFKFPTEGTMSDYWSAMLIAIDGTDTSAEYLTPTGTQFTSLFRSYSVNFSGNGQAFQVHAHNITAEGKAVMGDGHFWGGDMTAFTDGEFHSIEMTILPTEAGAAITIKIDGVDTATPNTDTPYMNTLTDKMVIMLGNTQYNNIARGVMDDVVISVLTEVSGGATETGDSFTVIPVIALLAVATIAVVVSKKKTVTE